MKYLKESHEVNNVYYHGTVEKLPFDKFNEKSDGSGICNISGEKYGGFFFTSSLENAESYTEYFLLKVKVNNINISSEKIPRYAMINAIKEQKNYLVRDILDGVVVSDILVVPHCNLNDITILEWVFVGVEDFYFDKLDHIFGDEERFVTKDMIADVLHMIEIDINKFLSFPILKKYYDTK